MSEAKIKILVDNAQAAKNLKDVRKALKDINSELLNMSSEDEGFYDLAKAAGELQDKLGDTRAAINFFADDFRNIKGTIDIVEGLAGGFAVAQGAVALFGTENQALNETLQKTQGILAILNGLQSISNKLNKDSYASILLSNTAQKLWNGSLKDTIQGLKGVKLGLVSLGIGVVLTAVGLLVEYWDDLTSALNKAKKKFDELGTPVKVLISILLPFVGILNLVMMAVDKLSGFNKELKKSTELLTSEIELEIKQLEAQGASYDKIFQKKRELLKLRATEIQLNIKQEQDEKKKQELQSELNKVLGEYVDLLKEKNQKEKEASDNTKEQSLKIQEKINEAQIALMNEGAEKERAQIRENYRRKLEEIKGNSEEEKKLRALYIKQMNKELAAVDEKYTKEQQQKQNEITQQIIDSKISIMVDGLEKEINQKEEEFRRKISKIKGDSELEKELLKQLEEQKLKEIQEIKDKYQKEEEERQKQKRKEQLEEELLKIENDIKLQEQNISEQYRITRELVDENEKQLKELKKQEYEKQISDESLKAEQKRAILLQYQNDIFNIEKNAAQQRQQIREAEIGAASELIKSLGNLTTLLGEQSEEAIVFQKAVALAQISIDLSKAIGSLTANSSANPANAVTFGAAGAIQYATGLVQILSSIAQAKSILSSTHTPNAPAPKFAKGGLVVGPGTGTSDSITALLSNGEYVVNAKSTSLFGPIIDAINNIGLDNSFLTTRSVTANDIKDKNNINNVNQHQTITVEAYVTEKEITNSQKRISKIERSSRIY